MELSNCRLYQLNNSDDKKLTKDEEKVDMNSHRNDDYEDTLFSKTLTSFRHKLLIINTFLLIKLISMKLIKSYVPCSSSKEHHKISDNKKRLTYMLKFNNPFDNKEASTIKRVIFIVLHIIIFCIIIKYLALCYYQYLYHINQQQLISQIEQNSLTIKKSLLNNSKSSVDNNYIDKCALVFDIKKIIDEKVYLNLKSIEMILNFIGSSFVSLTSGNIVSYSLLGIVPISYLYGGIIFFSLYDLELNALIFIYKPYKQRQQIKQKLKNFLPVILYNNDDDDYINSSYDKLSPDDANIIFRKQHNNNDIKKEVDLKMRRRKINNFYPIDEEQSIKLKITNNMYSSSSSRLGLDLNNHYDYNNKNSFNALKDIDFSNLVKPANLSAKHHKYLVDFDSIFSTMSILSGIFVGLFVTIILIIMELNERFQHRLEQLKCQSLVVDAVVDSVTSINNFVYHVNFLDADKLSSKDELIYMNYDGSLISILNILLVVELKYYFTFRILINLCEAAILIVINFLWVNFYHNLYVISFLNNLKWLNQLERQLNNCINMIDKQQEVSIESLCSYPATTFNNNNNNNYDVDRKRLKLIEDDFCNDIIMINMLPYYKTLKNNDKESVEKLKDENKLTRALTIAYLNYELFRRQQKAYRQLSQILIAQVTCVCGLTTIVCYTVGVNIRNSYYSILFAFLAWVFLYLQWYLASGSFKTAKVDKLIKNMIRLQTVALYKDTGGGSSYALSLWRKQLISQKEARVFFAPRLFNLQLSFSQWITVNLYLFALVLVLLRLY